MDKNKRVFIIIVIFFLIILILVGIDISRRTTFPGSKGNLEQTLPENSPDPSPANP